jgi:hypothetical protein
MNIFLNGEKQDADFLRKWMDDVPAKCFDITLVIYQLAYVRDERLIHDEAKYDPRGGPHRRRMLLVLDKSQWI